MMLQIATRFLHLIFGDEWMHLSVCSLPHRGDGGGGPISAQQYEPQNVQYRAWHILDYHYLYC